MVDFRLTDSTPETRILLPGEIDPGWTLRRELPVKAELDDDGTVIVSDEIFSRYGSGERLEEALEDYIADLTGYHETVAEYAADNHPKNKALLEQLQEYLVHSD